MSLDPEAKAAAIEQARRAFVAHQDSLRRLGAIGQIVVGINPEEPPHRQFWARAMIGRTDSMPAPVQVVGFSSGIDALAELVERAATLPAPRRR